MKKRIFTTNSRIETEALGEKIALETVKSTVFAMKGDLGAGKTCFTAGFAKGMDYKGDVCSPTFAIVNEYRGGRMDIYHFDMYRVTGWEDLYSTGYFEALESGGVLIVEWSENIESALPESHRVITIECISENERRITVEEV